MGFRKYQKVEEVHIEAQDEAERIRKVVSSFGKTSAAELTPEEKRELLDFHDANR